MHHPDRHPKRPYFIVPGVPALPGRPISPDPVEATVGAEGSFASMGVRCEHVDALIDLMKDLRYDKCEERVSRILSSPAVYDSDREIVRMENLHDWSSDSGQCRVLRARLLDKIYRSGWLKNCNRTLKLSGHPPLDILDCKGRSPEYFCGLFATHFWLELEQRIPDGERVVLDPSFRIISEPDRYQRARHSINPKELVVSQAVDVKVGSVVEEEGQWRIGCRSTVGLGSSTTGETALLVGFYLYARTPRPFVELLFKSGEFACHFTAPDGCPVIDGPRASNEADEAQARSILEQLENNPVEYGSHPEMPTTRLVLGK